MPVGVNTLVLEMHGFGINTSLLGGREEGGGGVIVVCAGNLVNSH